MYRYRQITNAFVLKCKSGPMKVNIPVNHFDVIFCLNKSVYKFPGVTLQDAKYNGSMPNQVPNLLIERSRGHYRVGMTLFRRRQKHRMVQLPTH